MGPTTSKDGENAPRYLGWQMQFLTFHPVEIKRMAAETREREKRRQSPQHQTHSVSSAAVFCTFLSYDRSLSEEEKSV